MVEDIYLETICRNQKLSHVNRNGDVDTFRFSSASCEPVLWLMGVSLVDQILSLQKQLHGARTPHEQTGIQRQIEATDEQIDALVYELYGLTEEEIKIVEGKCV